MAGIPPTTMFDMTPKFSLCATFHAKRKRLQVIQPDLMQEAFEMSSLGGELVAIPTAVRKPLFPCHLDI